ncbi:MAG: cupin domain-containing protein [Pseudomonadota bacterium]
MNINSDYSQRAVDLPQDALWQPSPAPGVKRRMLDRIGDEVAVATSVVRYAPGSSFAAHTHDAGEEYLVLDGVFSDEHGDYPAGTYVRNPPGSSHSPFTRDGATIFVKLRQFDPADDQQVTIDTRQSSFRPGVAPGLEVLPLHQFGHENVALVRWAPGTRFSRHVHPGGEEIFVLEGTFEDEHGVYPAGSWLRSPAYSEHTPFSNDGCLIYVKTGHLPLAA